MRAGPPAAVRRINRPLAYPHRLMAVRAEDAVSADRSVRPHRPPGASVPRASNSAMTVNVVWMRCLDKRDHVVSEWVEVLGAGYLKALCDMRIYPLAVSGPHRGCRACIEAIRTALNSLPQRIPEQKQGYVS
jgi:hypothetical protein